MNVVVPKGGWTKDNLPEEFEVATSNGPRLAKLSNKYVVLSFINGEEEMIIPTPRFATTLNLTEWRITRIKQAKEANDSTNS